jgi:hypothetical protein
MLAQQMVVATPAGFEPATFSLEVRFACFPFLPISTDADKNPLLTGKT